MRHQPSREASLYRPAQVAKKLGCSEWWVKEQARQRRIPFSWIGGSYRFTDEHVVEIIRLFEVRPEHGGPAGSAAGTSTTSKRPETPAAPVTRLRARSPRRTRRGTGQPSTAA
jgi:Helix-turn-helix domain